MFSLVRKKGIIRNGTKISEHFPEVVVVLGTQSTKHLEALDAELHFEPGPARGLEMQPDILETIRAACTEGQVLTGLYARSDRFADLP